MTLFSQISGNLRPSRELLEYYRQKVAEYDGEYEKFVHKLEKYKCTYESVVSALMRVWYVQKVPIGLVYLKIGMYYVQKVYS